MKFSAVWITKNEGDTLVRSINSVKAAADEMIVVDTGSSDDTVLKAREAGARAARFDWTDDFSAARNHALDLAEGEIVFFLDADEWFAPALTMEDKQAVARIFTDNPKLQTLQTLIQNVNAQDEVLSEIPNNRILRKSAGCRYYGTIHEVFACENGDRPVTFDCANRWAVRHSGYAGESLRAKSERNIPMLEEAAKREENPEKRHLLYCYLLRESHTLGRRDDTADYLRKVLDEPALLRKHCGRYGNHFAHLLYGMADAAASLRERVSRREIQHKIFGTLKKSLSRYRGAATADLYYGLRFDTKERRLLENADAALRSAEKNNGFYETSYRDAEAAVCHYAAQASLRRGDTDAARSYAARSVRLARKRNPLTLFILLSCVRGLPAGEIIALLDDLYDGARPGSVQFLFKGTRLAGFRDVHAYYFEKSARASLLSKWDGLYLLLWSGHYQEAADAAKRYAGEISEETRARAVALAVLCAGDERFRRDNAASAGRYGDALEAYFTRRPAAPVPGGFTPLLTEFYPLLALAGGVERADGFARVFTDEAAPLNTLRSAFCMENGLFDTILAEPPPEPGDYGASFVYIQALLMRERPEEAVALIQTQLDLGRAGEPLLTALAAAADRARDAVKRGAEVLYDRYMTAYDRLVDWRDMLNTGYLAYDTDRARARALKTLTPAAYDGLTAYAPDAPRIPDYREVCLRAAALYEEKGFYTEAFECLRTLMQSGDAAAAKTRMAALIYKSGNTALAESLGYRLGADLGDPGERTARRLRASVRRIREEKDGS